MSANFFLTLLDRGIMILLWNKEIGSRNLEPTDQNSSIR